MKRRDFSQLVCAAGITSIGTTSLAGRGRKPNLLIIHTDEHNFRTLGCYRDLMTEDQAFVWGKGVKVDTPHIDSIAHDGAICTSYYASSPVCTPSRASLNSGLYPVHTGSPVNDMPLNDGLVTFAEVLKRNGYATSYVGKWHLDGDAKPGFAPTRKFGWDDNRYMINRGHWKLLKKEGHTAGLIGDWNEKKQKYSYEIKKADAESFTTDFLCDRTLEILSRDKAKPFCVMLSIPDPHGPNTVRAPYDTMFEEVNFENPRTMMVDESMMPKWITGGGKNLVDSLVQKQMQWYFGMVKCIDDNVGRILKYLKVQGLDKNTIVVFTSDHGDLMGEHKKHNKGNPYEASAKIPFLIRHLGYIAPGKVVRTAQSNVDFAPMALSMMGITNGLPAFHGTDTSADFQSSEKEVVGDRIVYITHANSRWVAAVNRRYKLVLSVNDDPWLFDLQKDPDELINFYDNPEYKSVAEKFQAELIRQMERYGEPGQGIFRLGDGSDPAVSAQTGGASRGTNLTFQKGVIDQKNLSVKALNAKANTWSRACTVPEGSFEKKATYLLYIEWESKGLSDDAVFYANFAGVKKDKSKKKLTTWTGAAGESGVIEKELVTGDYDKWTLKVGVKGGGHLLVKRIQITRK